jgi:hypothetical protein
MNHALLGIWHRSLRRIGPMGVYAALLLAVALALAAWSIQLDRQGEALRRRLQEMAGASASPAAPARAALPAGQQIGTFVALFPPLSQSAEDLDKVFQSARRRNIALNRGDYQLKDDARAALLILTATFPINASYAQTKEFVADVLAALPHAAMDTLSMARGTAGDSALETSVRFSLVYRRP